MENNTLNRWGGEYFQPISMMIVSGLLALFYYADDIFLYFEKTFLFWTFSFTCILNMARIYMTMRYPKMELRDEALSFSPTNRMGFKWVRLPLDQIGEIVEGQRKSGGIARLQNLATFTFRMLDGSVFEYFPGLPHGQRLNAVRGFIENIAEGNGIAKKDDEQLILDDCRKRGLQLILSLVGVFMAILVLSFFAHRRLP